MNECKFYSNEENGINLMESIEPSDLENGTEKIGKNYICNVRELSHETQSTMGYIYRL